MPAHLPPHSHCLQCEKPVSENESFCSDECRLEAKRKEKRGKWKTISYYVITLAIMTVIWIVVVMKPRI